MNDENFNKSQFSIILKPCGKYTGQRSVSQYRYLDEVHIQYRYIPVQTSELGQDIEHLLEKTRSILR